LRILLNLTRTTGDGFKLSVFLRRDRCVVLVGSQKPAERPQLVLEGMVGGSGGVLVYLPW
jgi:hypothetical protein